MTYLLTWTVLMGFACVSNALAQTATHLELRLLSGVHQGSYTLASSDSHCLIGGSEPERWDVLLGDDAPASNGLSIFVLRVSATELADGESDFSLIAGFGAFNTDAYTEYVLQPLNSSITLEQDSRERTRIEAMGETADGLVLHAMLTCYEVLDLRTREP
jgi:hypothetical protein